MATSLEQFFGGHKGATLFVNTLVSAAGALKNTALEQLMMAGNYNDFSKNQDAAGNAQQASDVHQDFVDFLITTAKAHAEFDVVRGVSAGYQAALDQVNANLTDALIQGVIANNIVDQIFDVTNTADIKMKPYDDRAVKSGVFGDCSNGGSACRQNVLQNVVDFAAAGISAADLYAKFNLGKLLDSELSNVIDTANRAFAALNRGGALVDRAQLLNSLNRSYHNGAIKSGILGAFNAVAKSGAVPAAGAAKTLNNAEARKTFEGIYGNWANLNDAQRKFFDNVLSLLSQPTGYYVDAAVQRPSTPGHAGPEVRLTADEIAKVVSDIKAGNLANLGQVRLNLNKDENNVPVFLTQIPNSPKGTHFWVTVGSLGRGDIADEDVFRNIFIAAYSGFVAGAGLTNLAGVQVDLATAKRSNDFNLNYPVFLRNVQNALDAADKEKAECPEAAAVGECGEDLPNFTEYVDMAFGQVWQWDSDEKRFYRLDASGNKKFYDEVVLDANNCYGTYLKDATPEQCKRVIDCLADGDSKTLAACMDILADKNLWDIAAEDVSSVHPSVVKTVLRKFGVQAVRQYDDDGKEYKVPMTFEQWETVSLRKLAEPVQKAIKSNDKLLKYLKGLLAACDANPAIINKFQPKIKKRGMGPNRSASNYVSRLSKKEYYDPREAESEYAIAAAQLRALPYGTLVPTLFSPNIGSLHNVSFFSNQNTPAMFGGAYAQRGGDFGVPNRFLLTSGTRLNAKNLTLSDGSGNIFEGLFKAIKAGLSDMGVAMNPADEKSIKGAVEKLKEIEQKLIAIVRRLSIAVRIGETLGANHFVGDRQRVASLPLETVRTNESARKFMENHVRELRDAYEALHGHYGNIATDLVTHVYPRYLDRCCEKKETKGPEFVDLSEPCE